MSQYSHNPCKTSRHYLVYTAHQNPFLNIASVIGDPKPSGVPVSMETEAALQLSARFCPFISLQQPTAVLNYNSLIYIIINISHVIYANTFFPSITFHIGQNSISCYSSTGRQRDLVCVFKSDKQNKQQRWRCRRHMSECCLHNSLETDTNTHTSIVSLHVAPMKLHACHAASMRRAQTKGANACIFQRIC